MSSATDIEIKAGPELDRAVAEAIGPEWGYYGCGNCNLRKMDCYTLGDGMFCSCDRPPGGPIPRLSPIEFHPSTDLNAAFAAAEAVGLWEWETGWQLCRSRFMVLKKISEQWHVDTIVEDAFEDDCWREARYGDGELMVDIDEQPTPALAICAAILRLKDKCLATESEALA